MNNLGRTKSNCLLAIMGVSLGLITGGCLEQASSDSPAPVSGSTNVSARPALVSALEKQATALVDGINKVIIEGDFIQKLAVENPPKPISLANDNEVQKFVNYMLSNETIGSGVSSYKPDSRVCSELLSKDDPAMCIKVMEKVALVQSKLDATSGALVVSVSGVKFFTLSYSVDAVAVIVDLNDVVAAFSQISAIAIQNGGEGITDLPTVHTGSVQLMVSQGLLGTNVVAHIADPIDLEGVNKDGDAFSIKISAAQNVFLLFLKSSLGIAGASVNLPAVEALLNVYDEQSQKHQVEVLFPGASGSLSLDNSLAQISLDALKLASKDVYFNVDGQAAFHGILAEQLDAKILAAQGGHMTVNILGDFSPSLSVATNSLVQKNGTVSLSVAQGTSLYFPYQADQAQVKAGEILLTGTGDFNGTMDAPVNSCIHGQDNASLPLALTPCL